MTVQGQVKITTGTVNFTSTEQYLCPDLLRLENIGAADNARGKIVRWMVTPDAPALRGTWGSSHGGRYILAEQPDADGVVFAQWEAV